MPQSMNHETPMRASRLVIEDGIAAFSHQSPAVRNALSTELMKDYCDLLDRIGTDRSIRVLILTGSDGSFCAGGNITAMRDRLLSADPEVTSPDYMRRRIEFAQGMLARLRALDIPVIAAVDGAAYGAGFGLALQADFVLASQRAAFSMSFARVGAVPDFGAAYTLPRIVGMARAKEIVLTARRIDAGEGVALGFVHSIHAADDLLPQAWAMARKLADGPREAFGLAKRMLNASFESDYATAATLEACAQAVCMNSAYHREAATRFANGEGLRYDWDRNSAR